MSASITFPGSNSIEITVFNGALFQPEVQVEMRITWPKAVVATSNFTIQTHRRIGAGFAMMESAICCALWIK